MRITTLIAAALVAAFALPSVASAQQPVPTPTPYPGPQTSQTKQQLISKSQPAFDTAHQPGVKLVSAGVGTTQRIGADVAIAGLGQPAAPPAPKETEDTAADQTQQANETFDRLMQLMNQMNNTRNNTAGRVAGS